MLETSRVWCGAAYAVLTGFLTISRVVERTGVLAGASTPQIAFASHRDGNWEIYLTDIDGRHQTRLTRSEPQDRFPLWSPDRSRLAFGSQVGGDHWELWVMNVDGSNPRPLATQIVAKGRREWSHDGTRIVFAAKVEGDIDIFSVDVASGRLVRLTHSPAEDADPSWSSDDSHIVFSSIRDGNSEIYTMRADGTESRRLTNHAAADISPTWSPDGSRIAFISKRDGDRDVYLLRVDNGRMERLTTGAHATNDMPQWSPNGAYIAVQTADSNYDIQLVRVSDHERRTIAGTPAYDGQFSWSPASDQLAFISGRDGFDAVYITDLSGMQRRLTTTSSLDPEWSP
jgi:Tol biopolymer transport system component